ncbi:MAG: tetratricopeptide repeat protein [Desulfuromonadales bacterium]
MKQKSQAAYAPPDPGPLQERYQALRPSCEKALQDIYHHVRELLEANGLSPTIKHRVKRFDNYYQKLLRSARRRKSAPVITDLLGLRIICPFLGDVEKIEDLIRRNFEVAEVVRKAAGHSFREFGYDSLHLLVKADIPSIQEPLPYTQEVCEIQLRTILQDAWAEVEHELVYKSQLSWPNRSIRRKLAALNATLTLSDHIFQEIRDYQKGVMVLGQKRRALESALLIPDIEAPLAGEDPPDASLAYLPANGSPLEKAMFEALEAHSRSEFGRAVELYSGILGMRMDRKIRSLIYNHRGMALFSLSRAGEALKDFSRAIQYDGENLRARCNSGLIYRLQKRHAQAVESYDLALAHNPSFADAWLGRAQAYLEMKFPDRALADCEKALEINPDYPAAAELRTRIYRDFFRR